ncbi:hypothetical protein AVEN_109361-1 [Araneus ventricosus]|uniref:Uncharacterized protein n=1 Tax=Araneus ventricosus TaxID=182803 RepID=A0A4Y2S603_ARAVE|nr:hypothetical protein AVEN_109361-1 [Araneus ventricosus]
MLAKFRIAAKVQVGSLEPLPIQPRFGTQSGFQTLIWNKVFSSNSDVKTAAEDWFNGQGRDFYQAGLNKLVLSSDKCLNRFGDYAKK